MADIGSKIYPNIVPSRSTVLSQQLQAPDPNMIYAKGGRGVGLLSTLLKTGLGMEGALADRKAALKAQESGGGLLDDPKGEFAYAMKVINSPQFKELPEDQQKLYKDFAATKAKGLQNVFGQAQAQAMGKGAGELQYKPQIKQAEELAKTQAENISQLRSMESKLPELKRGVEELKDIGSKATYTMGGQAYDFLRKEFGAKPTEGAVARQEYITNVANKVLPLLKDTFGAAFTAQEGESLKATLGDPNMTPEQKNAVLDTFINQKIENIRSKRREVGLPVQQRSSGTKTKVGGYTVEVVE